MEARERAAAARAAALELEAARQQAEAAALTELRGALERERVAAAAQAEVQPYLCVVGFRLWFRLRFREGRAGAQVRWLQRLQR